MRNFGDAQYVGALVTDTEFRLDHNRVVAADFALKHGANFRWNGNIIHTESADAAGERSNGTGGQLSYNWETRRYSVAGQVEHYDPGFRMDTAFLNRVGVTRGWQYQAISFYPEKRFALDQAGEPVPVGADGRGSAAGRQRAVRVLPALRFNFTRSGYLRVDVERGHETFAHQRFDVGRVLADGGAQVTKWLNLGGTYNAARRSSTTRWRRFRAGSARSARVSGCSRARSSITA